jgi:hypothetical protein
MGLKFCNSVSELTFSFLKYYAVETLHSLINFYHETTFQVLPLAILTHSVMQEIFLQMEVIDQEAVLAETISYVLILWFNILLFLPFSNSASYLQTEYCLLWFKLTQNCKVF